jgi:hypothetical protein
VTGDVTTVSVSGDVGSASLHAATVTATSPNMNQPAVRNILLLFLVVSDAVFMVPSSVIRWTSLTRRQEQSAVSSRY